jgi:hypothetical protein
VRDGPVPLGAGAVEDGLELRRGVADLGGVEADGRDPVAMRRRVVERPHRRRCAQVTQEAEDDARRDAVVPLTVGESTCDAVDDRRERDTAVGVRLRVEEDLGVPDALPGRTVQVPSSEVVEVLLGDEGTTPRVVDVEEGLEVVEHVRGAHRLDIGIWQLDPVPLREPEHELGLERALDVEV